MHTAPVHYHLGKFPPRQQLDANQLLPWIGPAHLALGQYDGLLKAILNARILLAPLDTQEAVLSSRIEGTRVTLSEVLEIEAGATREFSQHKRDDAEEVLNYRRAMRFCVAEMEGGRPLSRHLLKTAHSLLMRGVRGQEKAPGRYRERQNYIATPGAPFDQASFVPVPTEHLESGMESWEHYALRTDEIDPLVQLAVLHVEFESLHPFEDGNGRLGRMFIPLFLWQRGLLGSSAFYISAYLDVHREEYQERLRAVSRDDDWTGWCVFFLKAIRQQAEENAQRARAILNLYGRVKEQVAQATHSHHAMHAVDFLFNAPTFYSTTFADPQYTKIPPATAKRILTILRDDIGLLKTVVVGYKRRPYIYAFQELLDIADGKKGS